MKQTTHRPESVLPAGTEVVISAAGKGSRLRDVLLRFGTTKPMLELNGKPLVSLSIDRLIEVGVKKVHICRRAGDYSMDSLADLYNGQIEVSFLDIFGPEGNLDVLREVVKHIGFPFLYLDCDLLFFRDEFSSMLAELSKRIASHSPANVFVSTFDSRDQSGQERPRELVTSGLRVNKIGITSAEVGTAAGGGIYYWRDIPSQCLESEVYINGHSLFHFIDQLCQECVVETMGIKRLFDVDTEHEFNLARELVERSPASFQLLEPAKLSDSRFQPFPS